MTEIIYRIDRPFSDGVIEVYGGPRDGWYEWRILECGAVIHDSSGAGYGSPGIALRDALNHDEPPKVSDIIGSDSLSSDFKENVATWQYKNNLMGGLRVIENADGMIHPVASDYVQQGTLHSGGLYRSWCEAFSVIGAALDDAAVANHDRRYQVSIVDAETGEPTKVIKRGLTYEAARVLLDKLKFEPGKSHFAIQPDGYSSLIQ